SARSIRQKLPDGLPRRPRESRKRRDYFFRTRIQFTRSLISASEMSTFGGIAISPQTCAPPFLTLFASLVAASLSSLYLAATSRNAGPMTFLSTSWHEAQPCFFITDSAA